MFGGKLWLCSVCNMKSGESGKDRRQGIRKFDNLNGD